LAYPPLEAASAGPDSGIKARNNDEASQQPPGVPLRTPPAGTNHPRPGAGTALPLFFILPSSFVSLPKEIELL